MSVRVRARLTRPGSTYLAGETIHARVELHNSADTPCAIAWCCCQVHCQAVVSSSYIKPNTLPGTKSGGRSASTAFVPAKGDSGAPVYTGRPAVICCNLVLQPRQTKQLAYSECIADEVLPPSFRGKTISYHYKLTVGVQAPNAPVKMLRVPFRLLTILATTGLSAAKGMQEGGTGPANPFLCEPDASDDSNPLHAATTLIENVTCVRNNQSYDVCMERGRVGKLWLSRSSYKLGDELVGQFDFTDADVPCVQYLVTLEQIEDVTEEYRAKADQPLVRTAVWDFTDTTLYANSSQFRLAIPLSACASFFTDAVHVKWRLQFEFVLAADTKHLWPVDDLVPD